MSHRLHPRRALAEVIARLIPLLALGAAAHGCRDADAPLAPPSRGPLFRRTPGAAPEGKITFHSNRDGDFEVFVMNADGSGVTQLTHNDVNELLPIWSPDGSRIAFGRCQAICDVVVINADGSGERAILSDAFPGAWSPDGNRIAFSGTGGGTHDGVFIVNADGSNVVRVADPHFVTGWSPDGQQLLIFSDRDGDLEMFVLNLDGGGLTRLTDNDALDGGARAGWSPDGARIAFSSDRDGDEEIFVMNADGSGVTQLTRNRFILDGSPFWSPDGTQLAFYSYEDGDAEVFVMNADGTGVTQLTFNEGFEDGPPSWARQVAPANDDFGNATSIPSLPFADGANTILASSEAGEPTPSCATPYGPLSKTIWYAFTAAETQSISARIVNAQISTVVAAYTGNAVSGLTEVGCNVFGGNATFRADANTTYYFQVAGLFGQSGVMEFRLEVAPPPVAQFGFNPGDPSIFDVVQFFDFSFDPAGVGFASQEWAFGDGATGTSCCPTHQYGADGDYTVGLTVTTLDGRTGSTEQVVQVRTHDVAITRFAVPKSASAGQTRSITVGINSKRYRETVDVQLFKSIPGGFQFVGVQTQSVPVRSANRTTDFSFSYTFTADDARVGKVTFKAIANITTGRDALPADNEAIAAPTSVSR